MLMCVGCCYLCKKCCGCEDPPRPTQQTIVVHQPVPGQFQQQYYDPNQQGQWPQQQMYAPVQQSQWQQPPPIYDPNQQLQPGLYVQQPPFYPPQQSQWTSPPPGWNQMPQQQGYPPVQQQWNK